MKLVLAFTVIFRGIISQVDLPSNETTAVIPVAPHHAPSLCIQISDVKSGMPPSGLLLAGNSDCPDKTAYRLDLRSARVTFSNIDETAVTRTSDYDKYTLPLSRVSGCKNLKTEVKNKQPLANEIHGYVSYPGGELSVRDFFRFKGESRAKPRQDPQCYACTVVLTMDVKGGSDPSVTLSAPSGSTTLSLSPSAEIAVVNGYSSQPSLGHFVHHYKIFSGCNNKQVIRPTNEKCDKEDVCAQSSNLYLDTLGKLSRQGWTNPPKHTNPLNDVECTGSNFP